MKNEEKLRWLGGERAVRDYNEIAVFKLLINSIDEINKLPKTETQQNPKFFLMQQKKNTFQERIKYTLYLPYSVIIKKIKTIVGKPS